MGTQRPWRPCDRQPRGRTHGPEFDISANGFRGASGRAGDVVKISLESAERVVAMKRWPAALGRFDALVATWERATNVVELTPENIAGLVTGWAAWIAGDWSRLDRGGESSALFAKDLAGATAAGLEDRFAPRNSTRGERLDGRLAVHATEAASLAGITVAGSSVASFKTTLRPAVEAATGRPRCARHACG